ncbi:GNAT family N-acetyltransferase [Sutcliffiella rhizosphaerae]|uniref:N-acetyltransferase domain-containing protein n=1 Tax=Sutcliffiella rhizosphaerae TaxID=2880967 RepID=A0ABM8YNH6_9BACI|nr:GNAT family N-acetyltransferase [Sutcliffiella rhizosphaerae]CAG9621487.1 hypothetical protein BACCIP111883_02260 [Sutcliffiella rhizosphaerae]
MSEKITLIKPTTERQQDYMAFYEEWIESGETMVPWVITKAPTDFQAMVRELLDAERGIGIREGWVPDSTYWLLRENDQTILGAVNIRHSLTDFLRNAGGHIGYGIRPSERRKGYATKILELALQKAKVLGIKEALVVCDEENIASWKTIIKNGGNQVENFVEESGNVVKRFWITC